MMRKQSGGNEMNKYQKALDKTRSILIQSTAFGNQVTEPLQELIDKATPYIPLDWLIARTEHAITRISGTCKCGLHYSLTNYLNDLEDTYYNGFHCSKCGQKLKWKKEENNV